MSKKRTQKDKEKERIQEGEPKGISGLINLGNSCYLNSILQCLLHLPEMIIYMNSPKLNEDLECNKTINKLLPEKEKEKQELHYKLIGEFNNLLKQIWKGFPIKDLLKVCNNDNNKKEIIVSEEEKSKNNNKTKCCLEPKEFKKILSEAFPQFTGNYQQDAHEVLTSILDSFHLALNKTYNEGGLLITSSISDINLNVRKTLSFIADASHKAVNDSFIEDTFFGQLSSIFTCYKCHQKIKETYEPFSSLELTIPIKKNINLFILPLNHKTNEQIRLNININDNMSYEDLYNQVNKITGYIFENFIIYWPNFIQKKKENKKTRNLRSNKKENNDNNLTEIYENEDIIINENNIDKCQNFISFKTNELIMMENYDMNFFISNNSENIHFYEYYLEIRIMKNNKNIPNNNNQENIPRIFKVYVTENGDDHIIYNYIYQYLELFTEKGKNQIKNEIKKKNKKNLKKEANKLVLEEDDYVYNKKNNNSQMSDNCLTLEEEKEFNSEKKYILGVICKNVSKDNNNTFIEIECPLCNKKSKKISDELCECFCINDFFDNELKIKSKDSKKLFSSKLINFIEQNEHSLLSIKVHTYQNFSFANFNKFSILTASINISKSKQKLAHQQNLMDLFESFASPEKIENFCICEKCGDIKYTYQQKDIHKFPRVLIIHIKRFKNEMEKNEERIEFPEEIDLSKYNNKGNIGKYSLNSAVFHQGTLISGHYTAIFKYLPNNKWLFCNDTRVKFLTSNKIIGLNSSYKKDEVASIGDGYILFYRKKN